MTTVGNIGIGLLIILLLWIVTIIVFVVGIKFQSNIAWIALALASVLTVILLCIPTEKHYKVLQPQFVEKDFIIIYKNLILLFLIVSALAGLFVFFISYCIESVHPKPLKTFHDS